MKPPDIPSLIDRLREAADTQQFGARRNSKSEAIRAVKREIRKLRARGATWAQVAAVLNESGLIVSADTVRLALIVGTKSRARLT